MADLGGAVRRYKWAIFLYCAVFQASISIGGYSGFNIPPKYGDFEAQRHWMEITTNLPISEWYVNSTDNDLNYWGLDYPPLTAYHSYVIGKISEWIKPEWTALHTSRGMTDEYHKLFMRLSVMITFLGLYVPALWLLLDDTRGEVLLAAIFYPGIMLIDNGHFQYNHVSLGLFLWAVYCFLNNKDIIGSISFVLALNFKQMELYHALPVFVYLLARCIFIVTSLTMRPVKSIIFNIIRLGTVVIATFLVLWIPFFNSREGPLQVLRRIFPFYRGLFEDKVANFWCCFHVLVKLKEWLAIEILIKLSTVVVLLSVAPMLLSLFLHPTKKNFKMALLNSSLSFFLFSFQVHEKSILLAAVPALLLLHDMPESMKMFLSITNISMFPLLLKDGVSSALPYTLLYHCLFFQNLTFVSAISMVDIGIGASLCLGQILVVPPARFPHLFQLLNAVYSFIHFMLLKFYLDFEMLKVLGASYSSWKRASKKKFISEEKQDLGETVVKEDGGACRKRL